MSGIDATTARPPVKGGRKPRRAGGFANRPNSQAGFTYLGLLIIVMIMGAALAATGTLFSHAAQREKERELLFIGHEFRDAIGSYYRRSPGAAAYPKTLEELLDDKRFPMPQHHLRRLYADPMTGRPDWVPIALPDGGGIIGVRSSSDAAPVKTGNFDLADAAFENAKHYAEWQFIYKPPEPPASAQPPKSPAPKG